MNHKPSLFLGGSILLLLFCTLNPGNILMPNMLHMTLALALLVCMGIFSVFVWKEQARDEREQLHSMLAGKYAFLAGALIIVIGIVVQSYSHTVDAWLVLALGAMVLTKLAGIMWAERKK